MNILKKRIQFKSKNKPKNKPEPLKKEQSYDILCMLELCSCQPWKGVLWRDNQQKEKTKTESFFAKENGNDRTVAMTIGGPINSESDTLSTARRLKNSERKKRS